MTNADQYDPFDPMPAIPGESWLERMVRFGPPGVERHLAPLFGQQQRG